MNVFVSYQRADSLLVAHLLGYALTAAGHTPFIDTGDIGGGEPYRENIRNAIARAGVLLAVIGPAFNVRRLHEPASVVAFEWQRARFHGITVVPVLVDVAPGHTSQPLHAKMPADNELPAELRWFTRGNAFTLRAATMSQDVHTLVSAIPTLASMPRRAARVLWVDDQPSNNEEERRLLRPDGIIFDNVVSTAEAIEQLKNESYDLVITDLGRRGSSDASALAGASFIDQAALRSGGPPVIVYASAWGLRHADDLRQRGATVVTASRSELLDSVRRLLGRTGDTGDALVR